MLTFVRTCNTSACYVTSWVGWGGVGMLTFVRTCNTSACYATSWVGWGGVGMLTFVRTCNTSACYVTSWVGWGGVGMLTFVRTCNTSACYVTSWVGWGGCGFYPAGMINTYIYIYRYKMATAILAQAIFATRPGTWQPNSFFACSLLKCKRQPEPNCSPASAMP